MSRGSRSSFILIGSKSLSHLFIKKLISPSQTPSLLGLSLASYVINETNLDFFYTQIVSLSNTFVYSTLKKIRIENGRFTTNYCGLMLRKVVFLAKWWGNLGRAVKFRHHLCNYKNKLFLVRFIKFVYLICSAIK